MIKIENLTKKYSKQTVLDILSLEIPSGQTFGLIGNNGAGKTTLFSCLLDLIKPTKGKVINNDVEVSTSEDWKSFTTAFLDETFLIGYLMPEEYFYFIGELRGLSKIQVDNFVLKFEDFFHGEILGGKKYLRDLSKGNQKKVGVIAALIGAGGLGLTVYVALGRLDIGSAVIGGTGIVILAIILDRITQKLVSSK